jgi:hypothetical protein
MAYRLPFSLASRAWFMSVAAMPKVILKLLQAETPLRLMTPTQQSWHIRSILQFKQLHTGMSKFAQGRTVTTD